MSKNKQEVDNTIRVLKPGEMQHIDLGESIQDKINKSRKCEKCKCHYFGEHKCPEWVQVLVKTKTSNHE